MNKTNVQGPVPFSDMSNVALKFFAFGDTPDDSTINTCIGNDGSKENNCTRFNCVGSQSELPPNNTCTYEGPEYACIRDTLIPYMNAKIDAEDAAFMSHVGDLIGE